MKESSVYSPWRYGRIVLARNQEHRNLLDLNKRTKLLDPQATMDHQPMPDRDSKPLSKYGHLSNPTPEYAAAKSAIEAVYAPLWALPSWSAFREVAGDADAEMPPGGPDRSRDVTTELLRFPARDGHMVGLKVYRSPSVVQDATLLYRMHGGGRDILQLQVSGRGLLTCCLLYNSGWVLGSHEVDGVENVYAAVNRNIVVVSVDYRK